MGNKQAQTEPYTFPANQHMGSGAWKTVVSFDWALSSNINNLNLNADIQGRVSKIKARAKTGQWRETIQMGKRTQKRWSKEEHFSGADQMKRCYWSAWCYLSSMLKEMWHAWRRKAVMNTIVLHICMCAVNIVCLLQVFMLCIYSARKMKYWITKPKTKNAEIHSNGVKYYLSTTLSHCIIIVSLQTCLFLTKPSKAVCYINGGPTSQFSENQTCHWNNDSWLTSHFSFKCLK